MTAIITPLTSVNPHVAIGMPAREQVSTKFAEVLWAIGRSFQGRLGLIKGGSGSVVFARNLIIDQIMEIRVKHEFEYVCFLDTDLVPPVDVIQRLLAHKRMITCATYVRRGPPFDNLGHTANPDDRNVKTGLIEMSHVPTGCLLIHLSVFDKMTRPYFRFEADEAQGILRGEDYIFSETVRKLGYKIWCDIDLSKEIGHIYEYELRTEDPTLRTIAEGYRTLIEEQTVRKAVANG